LAAVRFALGDYLTWLAEDLAGEAITDGTFESRR
jgi:hypothetical protein